MTITLLFRGGHSGIEKLNSLPGGPWGWWCWHSNPEPTEVTILLDFFWGVGGTPTYELYTFFTSSPSEYWGWPRG